MIEALLGVEREYGEFLLNVLVVRCWSMYVTLQGLEGDVGDYIRLVGLDRNRRTVSRDDANVAMFI